MVHRPLQDRGAEPQVVRLAGREELWVHLGLALPAANRLQFAAILAESLTNTALPPTCGGMNRQTTTSFPGSLIYFNNPICFNSAYESPMVFTSLCDSTHCSRVRTPETKS